MPPNASAPRREGRDGGQRAEAVGEPPVLEVRDLRVEFHQNEKTTTAVRGISFSIEPGETLALVGESGSGKTVAAQSILRLHAEPPARVRAEAIVYRRSDLLKADEAGLRQVRGNQISMIFQEPMTALNPLHTVERQIGENLWLHRSLVGVAARRRILDLLRQVQIREPERKLAAYPHQLSGGQRQRVMIAMALANEPELLIADEPTTALDVTVQAQILRLLRSLQVERRMAMLLITHDLGVVRKMADRICVMQNGQIVESGPSDRICNSPKHPYTTKLVNAEPGRQTLPPATAKRVLMDVQDLKVWFPIRRGFLRKTVGYVKAVDGISVSIPSGQTLGIVGESGSGKTTLGLAILRLIASEGRIVFDGRAIDRVPSGELRELRAEIQVVFQDPFGSLSPRLSVGQVIEEGLAVHESELGRDQKRERVTGVLEEVGMDASMLDRYPHEFSGGQRQRIAIARALVLRPRFVVLDEPTSALDKTVQAQVVTLLQRLQKRYGLTYLFISHDLKVIRALSNRILVMRQGRVVEEGDAEAVLQRPRETYTRNLISAAFDLELLDESVAAQ